MRNYFFILSLLASLVMVVTFSGVSWGASISGTVNNSSGKSGRIYLSVKDAEYGDPGLGVSIPSAGAFTIRGVQAGRSYYVKAFMDTTGTGMRHANDPAGTSGTIAAGTGDTSVGTITLTNPSPAVAPVAPGFVGVYPGATGSPLALVMWDGPRDGTGTIIADTYKVYWSTDGSTAVGSKSGIPATDEDFWVDIGHTYQYYKVAAVVGGTEAASDWVQTPSYSGGVNVSGSVSISGVTATGHNLCIALAGESAVFATRVNSPSANQSYTIPNVQPGTYSVYAFIDMNDNGLQDLGDIAGKEGPQVTVESSAASAPTVYVTGVDAKTKVTTTHWKNDAYDGFLLNLEAESMMKQIVNISVTSGPNLALPVDMGLNEWGEFYAWLNASARPAVGDTYTFNVTYSDGSTGIFSPQVTGVLDNFPTATAPVGAVAYGSGTPTFTWTAPNPPLSGSYNYFMWLSGDMSWSYDEIPSSQLSLPWPSWSSALTAGQTYNWGISVVDSNGNSASDQVSFKPINQAPVISGFSPVGAVAGASVTITGSNFMSNPSDNTVTFNGVAAAVTSASETQLVVTVPSGATAGTVSVTTTYGTATSSGSFTLQYNLSTSLTGNGTVTSVPTGISCLSGSGGGCTASFDAGSSVSLYAAPNSSYVFSGWSGACTGSNPNNCSVTMNGNKAVTATFIFSPLAKIGETPYSTLTSAYGDAATSSVIMARENTFVENLTMNRDVAVTMKGGYDSAYGDNAGYTTLQGVLSVGRGSATMERFAIK